MERKVVFAGKIKPGISKSDNCLDIINAINTFKMKKEMKEILFLATMKIIPSEKRTKDILFHLDSFKQAGKIYPDFSSSSYVQNVIDNVKLLDEKRFQKYIDKLINYVEKNKVEFLKK